MGKAWVRVVFGRKQPFKREHFKGRVPPNSGLQIDAPQAFRA
jgi:hypothetical protein